MPCFSLSKFFSRAEVLALAGAILLIALQLLPAVQVSWEYQQAVIEQQPWRLLTAHLVHLNWVHVLINAAAWVVVARLFSPELRVLPQLVVVLIASLVIGLGLKEFYPQITWYRGFSGTLHGVYFAGVAGWLVKTVITIKQDLLKAIVLPLALLLGGAIKVALEQPAAGQLHYAEWLGAAVVPQAHLMGAMTGVFLGAFFGLQKVAPQNKNAT